MAAHLIGRGFVLSLPTLLSTRYGLEAALDLLNKYIPGRVEVAEVRGGWVSPVEVQCVKIYESRQGGGAAAPHGPGQQQRKPLADAHRGRSTQQPSTFDHLKAGLEPTPLKASWFTTASLTAAGRCSVVVTKPLLNCIYDTKAKDFKVIKWLEASGLMDAPPPPTPLGDMQQQHPPSPSSTHAPTPPLPAASSSGEPAYPTFSAPATDSSNPPQKDPGNAPQNVSVSSPSPVETHSPAAPSFLKRTWAALVTRHSPAAPQPGSGKPTSGQESSGNSSGGSSGGSGGGGGGSGISSGVQQVANTVARVAGIVKPPSAGRLAEMLGKVDKVMTFTAECFTPTLTVTVVNGRMMVSGEVKKMVGEHLHVSFVKGQEQLLQWGSEVGEDVAWTLRPPMHAVAADALEPCCMQMHAEHLDADLKLWNTSSSTQMLHQAATARLDFTPGLSRFGLSTINPLLTEVADVQGGARVCVSFEPEAMQLPYTKCTLKVSPLQVGLGQSSRAAQLYTLLKSPLGWGDSKRDSSSPSPSSPPDTLLPAGPMMSASIGTMEVQLEKGERMAIHRVDMLLGRPDTKLPVHVAMWGSCDLAADTFEVTIGLPVESLTTLGVKPEYLPENYVMPAAFVDDNTISITPGAARFSQLMLRQEVLKQQGASRTEAALGWVASAIRMASTTPMAARTVEGIDTSIQEDLQKTPALTLMLPEWQPS
ncbi:MAG: hypothetical protein WDW36_000589 [Sanguina aurantia]